MTERKERVFLGLALLMMIILFISSSMTFKQQTIAPQLKQLDFPWLNRLLSRLQINYAGQTHSVIKDGEAAFMELIIRKSAHFASYFLLALFSFIGLTSAVPQLGFRAILVWLATTGYAATDEYHQSLTGGRSPMIQDVMLDATGAFFGLLVALLIFGLIRHHHGQSTRIKFAKNLL